MPASIMTPEVKACVGMETEPFRIEVEKSHIHQFAVSVRWPKGPNALYTDEKAARGTRFGGIIAPPTYGTSLRSGAGELLNKIPHPKPRVGMNGGNSYEMLGPIRPGDVLIGKSRIASIKEVPRGETEVMLITEIETNYHNQLGEHVLRTGFTSLRFIPVPQEAKA